MKKNTLLKVIFLMGPTASGKSSFAIKLRQYLPVELINVDSALIYKEMNVGTAKPNKKILSVVPHRLMNFLDPSKTYSVASFCKDALIEMKNIFTAGRIPLLVGGTIFYFKALLEGLSCLPPANDIIRKKIEYQALKFGWNSLHCKLKKIDPISALRIHPNDSQRISRAIEVFLISGKTLTELTHITSKEALHYPIYQFALIPKNRQFLHKRIKDRFYKMLDLGFEKEVRSLFSRGDLNIDMPSIRCVGYRQMWKYIEGSISYNEMVYRSLCATRQLAKRQITWLRHWKNVHWLDSDDLEQSLIEVIRLVNVV